MYASCRSRLLHTAFALVIAGAAAAGASPTRAEDERPDLQIKVAGLTGGGDRNVKITVDNLSNWWSDKTLATVQTVPANANDPMVQEIPDLGDKGTKDKDTPSHFEFIYPLPENCDGHKVRASLTAGANYEGVKESSMGNNVHELLICNPKTASAGNPQQSGNPQTSPSDCDPKVYIVCPDGGFPKIDKIDVARTLVDARNLGGQWGSAGPHSRTLTEPSVFKRSMVQYVETGLLGDLDCPFIAAYPAGVIVGNRFQDFSGCNKNVVSQVVVNFDLDWLREVDKKLITRAELLADELPPTGYAPASASCVGPLGVAL